MDAKTDISARLLSQRVTEGPTRASRRSCDSADRAALGVFKKSPSIPGLKLSGRDVAKDFNEVGTATLLTTMHRDDGFPDVGGIIVSGWATAENLRSVTAYSNHIAVVTHPGGKAETVSHADA